jgi:tripartite ATP-independent transporter DctP family solute receptor
MAMHRNPVFIVIGALLLIALGLSASLLQRGPSAPKSNAEPAQQSVRPLRFGLNIPDGALYEAAARFASEVGSRSGGTLKIEVFPGQTLGTDDQMLEMARQGSLDLLLIPTAKLSMSIPAMQYADLPFYFPTPEDLYEMLDGEPGQMLLDKLRSIDLIGVTFWENGFKQFTGDRPLRSPEDFAGTRARIMKSRMLMDQFRAFGAHSIPIDFHATRQALADGVVDAQENPLIAIVSMGIHEVQPHLTLSNHGYLGYVFVISSRVFETLSPAQQSLLINTARALTPWEREETHRREAQLLETIRAAGVTIHTLSEDERSRFAAATAHIPGRFENVIGPDLLSRSDELLERKYGAPGRQILIGLDADLSADAHLAALAIKRGAQLAIEEINAGGGVLGKPLKLIARDHKSQASLGIANIEHFAANPDVVAVLGGMHSHVIIAEQETLHRLGLPMLAPWSASAAVVQHDFKPNHIFRASANDALVAPFLIEHVRKRFRRPALLVENSEWGRGMQRLLHEQIAQAGLLLADEVVFNRGATHFRSELARFETKGADVLLMIANPREGQYIMREIGDQPQSLPIVAHWGITGTDLWADNRAVLGKLDFEVFQTVSLIDNPRPQARALAERYLQRYDVDAPRHIIAPQGVAQAYDLVHLLAAALRKAGTSERQAVRDALQDLPPIEGAVRRYAPAFSAERHDALDVSDYRIARFDEHGALILQPR